MSFDTDNVEVVVSMDRIDLLPQLGEIYWRDWGDNVYPGAGTLDQWIATALEEAGNGNEIPVSFLAVNSNDQVLGGVALSATESDVDCPVSWTPWVTGMIVRPELRNKGIGRALLTALDTWVLNAGIESTWIVTGGNRAELRAVKFYERCGWSIIEASKDADTSDVYLRKDHR